MSVIVMANIYISLISKRIQSSWQTNLLGYVGDHRGGKKMTGGENISLEITPELQFDVNPIIVQYQTTANFFSN